ncbi:diaminopimelate epimerase [Rhodovibrio salinarum]|uniref:Diaminopimelate epimerase n=1 Tax=Rhodovibrio salinarum TaxID=1087 RepID=A0A934V005_9PROT|nr:diaminopimelate epimerase [Rhodovibrio salinarum]
MERAFTKMHGLGNDFVVVDARTLPFALDDATARRIADRRTGVGCDQLIVLEPATDPRAHLLMRIRNSDGGEVKACGNATRCVAARVLDEQGGGEVVVQTAAGLLTAWDVGTDADGTRRIMVDMGLARTAWQDIPLSREVDTAHLPLQSGPLRDAVGVSMGNPHAVFFVDDAEAVALATYGPELEHDPLFPERANISAAQLLDADTIRLRVWERGAGITQACGTGACATLVAAVRRGLTGRRATVRLDGGDLEVQWQDDGHVLMTGPVAESFTGTLNERMLAA